VAAATPQKVWRGFDVFMLKRRCLSFHAELAASVLAVGIDPLAFTSIAPIAELNSFEDLFAAVCSIPH
jgi:hypothetical protein